MVHKEEGILSNSGFKYSVRKVLVEGVRGPQGSQTEPLREVDAKGRSQRPIEGVFPGQDELLSPTHENIPSEQASGLAELVRKLC